MIEFPITLTSGGSVCLPGHAFALALGYTKNRGVYRLHVDATGEWADHPGILACAWRQGPGVLAGGGRLCGCARQRDRTARQWLRDL